MSWSTERAVGEFFASRAVHREGAAGELWRSTIPADAVFGIFHERQEAEVILDPNRLGEIVTVATYAGEKSEEMAGWE